MAATGLIDKINQAVIHIDAGRKGNAIRGKEQEARILYENGISEAIIAFQEAQATNDPKIIILAEWTFLGQELQLSDKKRKKSIDSLMQAIQYFDDAFLVLEIVEDIQNYKFVENSHPHNKKYRVKGYPKDAFHIACKSHVARIDNILRYTGIDPIEDALFDQRLVNLSTAQNCYIEKQKKALSE